MQQKLAACQQRRQARRQFDGSSLFKLQNKF
jgi:hypothetical protein